jgi:Na+/phosphate symporter
MHSQHGELNLLDPEVARDRAGRRAFANTLLWMSALLMACPFVGLLLDESDVLVLDVKTGRLFAASLMMMLLSSVPMALVARALARRRAASQAASVALGGGHLSSVAVMDNKLLDAEHQDAALRGVRNDMWRVVIGIGLIAPLFLHAVVFSVGSVAAGELNVDMAQKFVVYMGIAVVVVGHVHLVVIGLGMRFVHVLVREGRDGSAACSVLVATFVSCVPGVVLLFLPPLLVLITGAVIIPSLYAYVRREVAKERARFGLDTHLRSNLPF